MPIYENKLATRYRVMLWAERIRIQQFQSAMSHEESDLPHSARKAC
jgi:hypothetical protein